MDSCDRRYVFFLWRKRGGCDNRVFNAETDADVFIPRHRVDGCSLYVEEMGKVSSDSCCMTLIDGCFGKGGRERERNENILLTGIWIQ